MSAIGMSVGILELNLCRVVDFADMTPDRGDGESMSGKVFSEKEFGWPS
jgi:hypothetical protein